MKQNKKDDGVYRVVKDGWGCKVARVLRAEYRDKEDITVFYCESGAQYFMSGNQMTKELERLEEHT